MTTTINVQLRNSVSWIISVELHVRQQEIVTRTKNVNLASVCKNAHKMETAPRIIPVWEEFVFRELKIVATMTMNVIKMLLVDQISVASTIVKILVKASFVEEILFVKFKIINQFVNVLPASLVILTMNALAADQSNVLHIKIVNHIKFVTIINVFLLAVEATRISAV